MERLQKVLAAAGVASRRKCEEIIAAGRVSVNGQIVTAQGFKVGPVDQVSLDGKPVEKAETHVYYLLNKPAGLITTVTDTHGRPTVMDLVPKQPRVYPVGRLDLDTEGLLLLTNDGELTNSLLHPSREVEKVYRAVAAGQVTDADLARLAAGVELEDGLTAPAAVKLTERTPRRTVLEITIHEGRKRQVKRMFLAVGHKVSHLERIRFAFLTLSGLERGKYRNLTSQEIQGLKNLPKKRGLPRDK
ncbi:MAG TPA: pseudouridine synthase [Firmicutes bacterium]|nr:pseudouridine synthase [Bacillota bacterium]